MRRQNGAVGRAQASDEGRSGYGSESVRPYLRAQLKFKELMAAPFAASNPQDKPNRRGASNRRRENEDR